MQLEAEVHRDKVKARNHSRADADKKQQGGQNVAGEQLQQSCAPCVRVPVHALVSNWWRGTI